MVERHKHQCLNRNPHSDSLFGRRPLWLFSFWSRCECTLPPAPWLSPSQRKESEAAVTRAIRDFMFLLTVRRSQRYTHAHINTRVVRAHRVRSLYWQALGKSSVCHSANYLPILLLLLYFYSLSSYMFSII